MKLFDTHSHLNDPEFSEDLNDAITRMKAAGVISTVVVGDATNDGSDVLTLLRTEPCLFGAYGLHPHNADQWNDQVEARIIRMASVPGIVALGEIGLDYHYDFSPRETQKQFFVHQLELASELNQPVILHIREAHGDAWNILTEHLKRGLKLRGIMHCYGGSLESAFEYVKMGLYISFSGSLTFKNAPNLVRCAKELPLDRILIETDSPYMAPVPLRGRRNEPAFVRYVCEKLAEIRGISPEAAAEATFENALKAYGIKGATKCTI